MPALVVALVAGATTKGPRRAVATSAEKSADPQFCRSRQGRRCPHRDSPDWSRQPRTVGDGPVLDHPPRCRTAHQNGGADRAMRRTEHRRGGVFILMKPGRVYLVNLVKVIQPRTPPRKKKSALSAPAPARAAGDSPSFRGFPGSSRNTPAFLKLRTPPTGAGLSALTVGFLRAGRVSVRPTPLPIPPALAAFLLPAPAHQIG